MARPIIAQCRREIEIGWQHVEAARGVLRSSQWLIARWRDNHAAWTVAASIVPKPEMFIPVDPDAINASCRRRREAASA